MRLIPTATGLLWIALGLLLGMVPSGLPTALAGDPAPATADVTGRVIGHGGRGLPGIEVVALAYPLPDSQGLADATPLAHATSDKQGQFRLTALPAGRRYILHAPAPRGHRPAVTYAVAGASNAVLRLDRNFLLALRVFDPEGKPVSGARIHLSHQHPPKTEHARRARAGGRHGREDQTDDAGRFVLRNLESRARYTLRVSVPRKSWPAIFIDAWTPIDTTIVMERPRTLKGRIKHLTPDHGFPLAIRVEQPRHPYYRHVPVGKNGHFRVKGLAHGPVTLTPTRGRRTPGYHHLASWYGNAQHFRADDEFIDLSVSIPAPLTVRVAGIPAGSAKGASVMLSDPAQHYLQLRYHRLDLSPEGVLRVWGLDTEVAYTLWIGPFGDDCAYADDIRYKDRERELPLRKGGRIRVTLQRATNLRRVCLLGPAINYLSASFKHREADFRGLPPGTYQIAPILGHAWRPRGAINFVPWELGPSFPVRLGETIDLTEALDNEARRNR